MLLAMKIYALLFLALTASAVIGGLIHGRRVPDRKESGPDAKEARAWRQENSWARAG